jgi:pimeloyl-ACP methyl ester carboxylesterase
VRDVFSVEIREGLTSRSLPVLVVPTRPSPDNEEQNDGGEQGINADRQSVLPRERLNELSDNAKDYLPDAEASAQLWSRIVRDANSGELLGESQDLWSPLGRPPRPRELRGLRDRARLDDEANVGAGVARGGGIRIGRSDDRLIIPEIGLLDDDGEPLGAVIFGSHCGVAVLPEGTDEFRLDYVPTAFEQRAEDAAAREALAAYGDGDIYRIILWRTYFGANTLITDGVSRAGQWVKRNVRGRCVVIGRVLHARSKSEKKYPRDITRHNRLRKALSGDPEFAYHCPDISDVQNASGDVVIAVHGTMACAVPLAKAIKQMLAEGVPVGRFEHDTWLPVTQNAEELVAFLNKLDADRVTLVAHSRGGLVAARAAQISRHKGIRVITLGTPFLGTPIAHAGELSLLGCRSLLGAIRGLDNVFPHISLATRLVGFLVKDDIAGIADMEPRNCNGYTAGLYGRLVTVSGTVTEQMINDPGRDTFMFQVLAGVSAGAFDGIPNDLVVSRESARGDGSSEFAVDCDHFGYLRVKHMENLFKIHIKYSEGAFGYRPGWYRLPRP